MLTMTGSVSFLIMALAYSSVLAQMDLCKHGWSEYDMSCYLFVDDLQLDWTESWTFCDRLHGKLVEIESTTENSFIRSHLMNDSSTSNFWVGASDVVFEGEWMWMTSQLPLEFTDWSPGEPNSWHGMPEDCVYMKYDTKNMDHFHWNDGPCGNKYGFICEKGFENPVNVIG